MPEYAETSEQNISQSIVTGMGFVYDLFLELGSLFRLIHEQLQASDLELSKPMHPGFVLTKLKSDSSFVWRLLKTEMGLVVGVLPPSQIDEDVDEEDEEDLEEADDDQAEKLSKKGLPITPDSQFIAVRAMLYDPRQAKKDGWQPLMIGALLSSFDRSYVSKKKSKKSVPTGPQDTFSMSRANLLRLVRSIAPTAHAESRVAIRASGYEISAMISGILVWPLARFDSEEQVEKFTSELIVLADSG